jgi:perosamine synthetase
MEIPFHRPYITEDEINSVAECLRNGWLTMGPRTIEFEERFAARIGARHAVAVNSGTAALHLALCCIDLAPGDEVIIPAMTFVATSEVVRYFGGVPVPVDIEFDTHLMDASGIEEKITARTRAIIAVHYGGQPCDMDSIMGIAGRHGLTVIEDAAHSLPAVYRGRNIGTVGDITCFSFYATKTITTGEGGMAVTDNDEWAARMRMLRLHGISRDAWKRYTKEGTWRYDVTMNGFKYNMTDMAASMGLEQMKKIDFMNDERARLASVYDSAFRAYDRVIPYEVKEGRKSSWHLYPLKVNTEKSAVSRDRLIDELKSRGVMTSVHFIPLYRFTYYRDIFPDAEKFPVCEKVFERVLSLPLFVGMTVEEQRFVIESVKEICR